MPDALLVPGRCAHAVLNGNCLHVPVLPQLPVLLSAEAHHVTSLRNVNGRR